jgi:hypothetical protein
MHEGKYGIKGLITQLKEGEWEGRREGDISESGV